MGLSASQARMLQLTSRRSDIEYQMQQIASARLALSGQMEEISKTYTKAMNDRIIYTQDVVGNTVTKEKLTHLGLLQRGYQVYSTVGNDIIRPQFDVNLSDLNSDGKFNLSESGTASLTIKDGKYYVNDKDGNEIQVSFGLKDGESEGYDENNVLKLRSDRFQSNGLLSAEDLDAGLRDGRYQIIVPTGSSSVSNINVDGKNYTNILWSSAAFLSDELNTENDPAAQAEYDSSTAEAQSKDKQLELKLKNLENEHKAVETEMEGVKKVIEKNIEGTFKTFV